MNSDDEWDYVNGSDSNDVSVAKSGLLRVSLLFGSIAVAFALFLVPVLSRSGLDFGSGKNVDQILTGSISNNSGEYTLRRSVLQRDPASFCVIRDGRSEGDC